jgi:hypothetical protein
MKPILIGLTGRAKSGKTTAASYLRGKGMVQVSYASALKQMLMALGLTSEEIFGEKKDLPCDLLGGATPRWAMQSLGTEWGRRMIHENLWVNAAIKKVAEYMAQEWDPIQRYAGVVVDDVRFPNEAAAIKQAGGYVYRIARIDNPEIGTGTHESEAYIDTMPVDGQVFNGGAIEDLYTAIDSMLVATRTDMKVVELRDGQPGPNDPLIVRVTHMEQFHDPLDYGHTFRVAGSDLRGNVWLAEVVWTDGKPHALPPVGQSVDFHKPPFTNVKRRA